MNIRRKLLIAFSIYLLLALIPAAFSYRELSAVRKRLKPVEAAGDITNSLLEVRKNERNFLLLKDSDSLQLFRKQISMLKGGIDDIEPDIVKEIGEKNYSLFRAMISRYEELVQKLADNFNAQQKTVASLTELGRSIEHKLPEKEIQTFLVLRRYEKNLIIYRDEASISTFRHTYARIKPSSAAELPIYASVAEKLYSLYDEEKAIDPEIKKTAAEIKTFTDSLLQVEREDIDALLAMSMNLLLLSLIAVIVIGAIINIRLASGIAAPIRQIRKFAEQLAEGDYSQTLDITGAKELSSLAEVLNQMAVRMKDTVSSLELAIKNLHGKQGQLVEAEKLASLGRIAAGVAHEINNPLAIINEKAGLMQDMLELSPHFSQKPDFQALIDGIIGSVTRCRSITHRLLGFSRKMEITIELFNLNDTIRETIDFLKKEIQAKSSHIELNLAEDLPNIKSDKLQVQQVFLNLIKNAVDATPEAGQITVTTTRLDDGLVRVNISDNGPGIPKDVLKHIFEPFFTTKERGKGTGLGLFVTHAILKKLKCNISVQSEVGRGTTFSIDIPVNPPRAEEVAA